MTLELSIDNLNNYDNYRNFLLSERFQDFCSNSLNSSEILASEKLAEIIGNFINKKDLTNEEYKALTELFNYNSFTNGIFKQLSPEDIKKLSKDFKEDGRFSGFVFEPSFSEPSEEQKYEKLKHKVTDNFLNYIKGEIKYRRINQAIKQSKSGIEGILKVENVFSGDRFEIVQIGENYYVYDKKNKNTLARSFKIVDCNFERNEFDIMLEENYGTTDEDDRIYKTPSGDYLTEIKKPAGNSILFSLNAGEILTPEFSSFVGIKIFDGKTIVSFYSNGGNNGEKHFCIETQEYVEVEVEENKHGVLSVAEIDSLLSFDGDGDGDENPLAYLDEKK